MCEHLTIMLRFEFKIFQLLAVFFLIISEYQFDFSWQDNKQNNDSSISHLLSRVYRAMGNFQGNYIICKISYYKV